MSMHFQLLVTICLLIRFTQANGHHDTILYVSSNGTDLNNTNCSQQSACGTLYWALELIENDPIISQLTEFDIYITGFNTADIMYNHSIRIAISVNLTFDMIHHIQLSEWQAIVGPIRLLGSWRSTVIVINNLYINGYDNHVTPVLDLIGFGWRTAITLILNNCTFRDVVCDMYYSIHSVGVTSLACFISSFGSSYKSNANIEIYDSVFSNISSNAPLIQAHYTNITLIRSTFHDLYWINSPIIFTKGYDNIHMQYNIFKNINFLYDQNATTFKDCSVASLLCIECPGDALNVVYINDSSFHNINGPIIISRLYGYTGYRTGCRYNLNVFMNDITISTSRVIMNYFIKDTDHFWLFDYHDEEYNYDKALIIASSGTELVMNNIILTYKLMDNLNDNCVIDAYWPSISNQSILAQCAAPFRFLYNEGSGYIDMNNVYITNDITQEGLEQFKSDWIVSNSMPSDVVYSLVFVYIDANDSYSYLSEPDTELIFNNGSQLFIHNMTLYGVALHQRVLHNIGTAFIDNFYLLRPDYWDNNLIHVKPLMRQVFKHEGSANDLDINNYDSEFINEYQCFFGGSDFENGFLVIKDSTIFGGTVAVHVSGGFVEIHNTSISNVVSAVFAEDATSVKITSSHFMNIGRYHVAAWISWRIFNTWWYNEVVSLSSVEHITIRNNVFEYFPVYWYLLIFNSFVNRNSYAEVIENEFKNPITRDTFSVDQFGSVLREYYRQRYDNWNDTFDAVQLTYAIFGAHNHYRLDLINFDGFINASFIANIFHHDEFMTTLESSCLSVWSHSSIVDKHNVCIWGNLFYGSAISLTQGANVTSCIYPELSVHNNTECWHNYGAFNSEIFDKYTDAKGDRFTATDVDVPLFKIMDESTIIIYNAIISTQFEDDNVSTYNPFNLDPEYWFQSEVNGIISFLDVTINESSDAIEIQFYEECINKCTQIYRESLNDIHQLHINCINVPTETSSISLSESLSLISLNSTLAHRVFLNTSGVFYPGGALDLSYVILDSYNNIINDWNQSISISLLSNDFSFETTLYIQRLSACDICETGFYVPNAKMNESANSNNSYTIVTNVTDNSLYINDLSVTMIQCPIGYGFNERLSICYECHIGECSIQPSLEPCISCVASALKGVLCIGADKVMISQNYWVAFNYFGDGQIVSQYCPHNYCNQIPSGLYLELLEFEQLCSLNRDPEVALCGSCKPGYSELYGSANCGKCDRHRYELWILLVIMSVLFTLFIIFIDGSKAAFIPSISTEQKSKKCTYCRQICHLDDEAKEYIKISLSKPISYFYQCVTFILVNGGIFVYISGFAEIFNFQFDFGQQNKSNTSGYCVFKGIDAKFEIISRLLIPSCCILTLIIMLIVHKVRGEYSFCGRRIFLAKSAVSILLLTISSFCGVCFKLLSCRNIGDDYSVHFYFGSDECYDTIWFVSLFVLVAFVLMFCSLFMKLYVDHKKQNNEYLKQNTYVLSSLVKSYKINQYWYWELVIFSKRLFVALLTVVMDTIAVKNILFVLLALYLCAQMYCNPFVTERINGLESMCILCLMLILYILDNATDEEDSTFSLILLNMVLLFPLILWIIQLKQTLSSSTFTCACNESERNATTTRVKEHEVVELIYSPVS